MASMTQAEMRAELARRGLVNYGTNHNLQTRLSKDQTRGLFKGNFANMSDEYLQEGCKILSIPRTRDRQSLINNIRRYNAYKEQKMAEEEAKGPINAGLPIPDDRLGEPTENVILGTRSSSIYSRPYTNFRYWQTLQ